MNNSNSDSNLLMVVSFLFIGIFFIFFSILIELKFHDGILLQTLSYGESFFSNLNGSFEKITFSSVLVILLYSLGFIIYCLSFILISYPTFFILKLINYKDVISECIDKKYKKSKKMTLTHKFTFVYLRIRAKNDTLSKEAKFFLNQIMFARSCLAALVLSLAIELFFIKGYIVVLLFFISYIVSICIYQYTITFWEKTLYTFSLIQNDTLIKKESHTNT